MMRPLLAIAFCLASLPGIALSQSTRPSIVPAKTGGKLVPASVMERVYEEAKTPFKYGVVVRPEADQWVDCPTVFRGKDGNWYMIYVGITGKVGYQTFLARSDDLLKWDENFYTHRVGGDALQALLHRRGVLTGGDTITYAFGNTVYVHRGLRAVEHGGVGAEDLDVELRAHDRDADLAGLDLLGDRRRRAGEQRDQRDGPHPTSLERAHHARSASPACQFD